jgi:hypothetical protein
MLARWLRSKRVPDHETVLRLPKRMMQFFKEVSNGGAAGL